jgi:hypothetical protein
MRRRARPARIRPPTNQQIGEGGTPCWPGCGPDLAGTPDDARLLEGWTLDGFDQQLYIMVLVYLCVPIGDAGLLLLGIPLNASILMKFAPMGPFMTELYPTDIRGTGQGASATMPAGRSARYL